MGGQEAKVSPEEMYEKWKEEFREKQSMLRKEVRGIENSERKAKLEIQKVAAAGDRESAALLAKEYVRLGKSKQRLMIQEASLKQLNMTLRSQLANNRVTQVMQDVTPILESVNTLMSNPELRETMTAFQKEMMKMGIKFEMQDQVMDQALGVEDEEEEVEDEVNKVMTEIAGVQLSSMTSVPTRVVSTATKNAVANTQETEEEKAELDNIASAVSSI